VGEADKLGGLVPEVFDRHAALRPVTGVLPLAPLAGVRTPLWVSTAWY
jgi:hypothetical protein